MTDPNPAYHLLLEQDETDVTASALRLLVADATHQPQIRGLARAVLGRLDGERDEFGVLSVPLSAPEMKIARTAVSVLHKDLGHDEAKELEVLRRVLDKLPDEHALRAIDLDQGAATLVDRSPPPRIRTADAARFTVADVMHAATEGLSPALTVGELRDWFAGSDSRRLAMIADGDRYLGSLTPTDIDAGAPAERRAIDYARTTRTLAPDMPADAGRDLVIRASGHRLPVVDAAGRLRGVLAVTSDLEFFACRPHESRR